MMLFSNFIKVYKAFDNNQKKAERIMFVCYFLIILCIMLIVSSSLYNAFIIALVQVLFVKVGMMLFIVLKTSLFMYTNKLYKYEISEIKCNELKSKKF